jgi:uncharacterized protein involved in exopolysaccharide biosynthesis
MDDELDLGHYLRILVRHARLGIVVFLLTAGAVLIANLLRPASYTATATLFAGGPQYQWRFDSRLSPNTPVNVNWQKMFLDLAKDPWFRNQIAAQVEARFPGKSIGEMSVRAGKQSLIHIDVTAPTPQEAAKLANAWAEAFANQAEKLYGATALSEPFAQELKRWEEQYQQAVQAVEDFKARTGVGISSEGAPSLEGYEWLGALGLELAERSRQLAAHRQAIANLQLLKEQLEQARRQNSSLESLPWQLLDAPTIAARGILTHEVVAQHLNDAGALAGLLDAELTAQQAAASALEQRLNEDQARLARLSTELDRLVEERNLARENYLTLQRKVSEIEIENRVEGPLVRVVGEAAVPEKRASRDWPVVALLAVIAGAVLGTGACLIAEYLARRPQ